MVGLTSATAGGSAWATEGEPPLSYWGPGGLRPGGQGVGAERPSSQVAANKSDNSYAGATVKVTLPLTVGSPVSMLVRVLSPA
jgi:hypothetical protein